MRKYARHAAQVATSNAREGNLPAAQFHHFFPSRFRLINSSNRSSTAMIRGLVALTDYCK